jgi:hypothetical protein
VSDLGRQFMFISNENRVVLAYLKGWPRNTLLCGAFCSYIAVAIVNCLQIFEINETNLIKEFSLISFGWTTEEFKVFE